MPDVPFGLSNSPRVGLQAHSAVSTTVVIATIAAGASTTEVEVHITQAHSAVSAVVVVAIATTGFSLEPQNGPGLGSEVGFQPHYAIFTAVAIAAIASGVSSTEVQVQVNKHAAPEIKVDEQVYRACAACTEGHI